MATRSTVCPGCHGTVPRGRPSCPSCGLLLTPVAGPSRGSKARATPAHVVTEASEAETRAATPTAGAYIPPAASPPPQVLQPRSWAGLTSVAPRPMAVATAGAMSPGAMTGSTAAMARPVAGAATMHPADEPTWLEATAGWLTIIGSAVAILGFLLPWSQTVIGAESAGSYFDSWGMANPSHLLVVLALLAVLGLAIVANPIPTWIRTCAAGLILGGLLVGLTWPYLIGPLGAGPGVMAILVGGVMLVIAGILDLVEARHAESGPVV